MVNENISIVMYHYVRDFKSSNYNIKGLDFEGFKRQLSYLSSNYDIITYHDIVSFFLEDKNLPSQPCLLTFDDGLKDHIRFVLPEFKKRNISGCFFPPALPFVEKKPLDVHLIHLILSRAVDLDDLVNDLVSESIRLGLSDKNMNDIWRNFGHPGRFDNAQTMFVKKCLQRELPENVRTHVINKLVEKYIGLSESELLEEIYMSSSDIKTLIREGMYVGNHSYSHPLLSNLNRQSQELEIDKSLNFLKNLGAPTENWMMCYPYGAYNSDTINIVKNKGCLAALTTKVGMASLYNQFELSRLNTNDYPQ